ncbi:MAG: hypothetical protein GWO02_11660, partial [Gammaproteobacteria bacterium]|nr:hypothetical protein [Gammaproteobacteria bacterium]
YMIDNTAPPSQGDIVDVVEVLTPYYSSVLPTTDHWSNDFSYTTNGVDDYQLESFGRDGTPGADITLATRFDFDLDIVLANGQ